MFKKIMIVLLALLMFAMLVSCGDSEKSESGTGDTSLTEGETDAAERILEIIADGASEYRIVRSETASDTVASAVLSMRNAIKNITGVELQVMSDLSTLTEKGDISEKKEILVGKTDYAESKEVLSECAYGDFIIRVCGNKIVVVAFDDAVTAQGCGYFSNIALKKGAKGSFSIAESELNVTRSITKTVSAMPRFEGEGDVQIIDAADGAYMLLVQRSNKNAFQAYCQRIEKAGYTLYTSHTATGNDFYTYVNDTYTLHVYYRLYDRSIRAIAEPRGILPATAPEQIEKVVEPSVTMLGLELDGNQIGLGMIFRLSNGHFLVLDGGNNKAVYADRLYQKLCELAPDKNNIVIDAWFISHGHSDHAGAMIQFAKNYSKKVTVKQFICNIPTDAPFLEIDDLTTENATRKAMKNYTGTAITKAHTGQIFYFGDAKIEMLYTAEDLYPKTFGDANSASLVFRVTLGGQTVMCLGDEYTDSSSILTAMYTNFYLKSDFVQASHHGRNGGTVALYSQIKADTVLWPGGRKDYGSGGDNLAARAYNQHLLSLCKDLYIAGEDGITLTLPYTVQYNKDANG
ncbi:MAG: hypothetical protein IJZ80_08985 [Clostridia bacterium]|nr:hypothetical protein [Clostridia bacterium]